MSPAAALTDDQAVALGRVSQVRESENQLRLDLGRVQDQLAIAVYLAMEEKVSANRLADHLGLTRARIYQMSTLGKRLRDEDDSSD